MKNKRTPRWVYELIIIFITLIIALGFFFFFMLTIDIEEPPNWPRITLKQTKLNESYVFEVTQVMYININNLEWWIISEDSVLLNEGPFPTESGVPSTGKSGNETVTWFDDNNDNKFNPGDRLVLKGDMSYLEGKDFRIDQNRHPAYDRELE